MEVNWTGLARLFLEGPHGASVMHGSSSAWSALLLQEGVS